MQADTPTPWCSPSAEANPAGQLPQPPVPSAAKQTPVYNDWFKETRSGALLRLHPNAPCPPHFRAW